MCQFKTEHEDIISPEAKMSQFYLNRVYLGNCEGESDQYSCGERPVGRGEFGFHSEEWGIFVPINISGVGFPLRELIE